MKDSRLVRFVLLLSCLLPVWTQALRALDIPFYAGFYSANLLSHYPSREGRAYAWGEKYLLACGVDSLREGSFGLDIELLSRANFSSQQILIDRLELSFRKDKLGLVATTRPQGVGENYYFQQKYVQNADFNRYQSFATRFNGLDLQYAGGKLSPFLGLGGNVHNLAMGYLGIHKSGADLNYRLRLDASARDTHWTSPQVLPSLAFGYAKNAFEIRSDAAWNHIFAYQGESAKEEYFGSAELGFRPKKLPALILGIRYLDRDHAPRRSLSFDSALQQNWGKLSLIPGYSYQKSDKASSWQLDLLAQYQLFPQNTIGIYAVYEQFTPSQACYRVGLQSSLRLDF